MENILKTITRVTDKGLQAGIDAALALELPHMDAVAVGRAGRLAGVDVTAYRATMDSTRVRRVLCGMHETLVREMTETREAFRDGLCVTEAECFSIMQRRDDMESVLHVLGESAPVYWRHADQEGHELMLLMLLECSYLHERWAVVPPEENVWWSGCYTEREQARFLTSAYNTLAHAAKGPVIKACVCGAPARWTGGNLLMCDVCTPWRPSFIVDLQEVEQEVLTTHSLRELQLAYYDLFQSR